MHHRFCWPSTNSSVPRYSDRWASLTSISLFKSGETMKFIVYIAIALAVVVGGYFGYQKYEQSKLIASLTPHVKNASIRVLNSTKFETESDSKATFKEVFERLETDITEIEKHLVEAQTLSTPKTAHIAEPSVRYMKASQEYLRALLQKFRRVLKLSSASDRTKEALDDLRSSSGYGFDYAKKRSDKALEELREAESEYNSAPKELAAAASALIESSKALQGTLASDALVPISALQTVVVKNKEVKEGK